MVMPQFHGGTLTALKWLAVVLMVADHLDWLLYGSALGIHDTLGRVVFPIFGFVLAYNAARPRALEDGSHGRTIRRLLLVGLAATPIYGLLAGWLPLNVMFALALGVLVINMVAHRGKGEPMAVAVFAVGGLFVDYQWFGLAYMLAVWGTYARGWSPLWIVAATLGLWGINGNMAALWALPLLWLASYLRMDMPRHQLAFYAVYPLHLGALLALGV